MRSIGSTGAAGAQTLMRGLDVIEAVVDGETTLARLTLRLGLARSTVHRLASALVERGYLAAIRPGEYRVGPELLKLGFHAQQEFDLVRIARPHIERLAALTTDTVHLAILDQDSALYLDKIPGQRRINISSVVGERQPLTSTGIGKALILDHAETYWMTRFAADRRAGRRRAEAASWRRRMREYARRGCASDLEENEDRIRCVAAPVRDAQGRIVGAISVASAAQYMGDGRMARLSRDVRASALDISRDIGYAGKSVQRPGARHAASPPGGVHVI